MSEHSIEQLTARLAILPARVIYLIAAGSRLGFRRAVQEASSRWAGMTELIVPVRSRGSVAPAWAQMIEHGAYDCLVNIDATSESAARAAEDLGLPLVQLRDIDRSGPSRWSVHPANVAETRPRSSASVMATSSEAPLWELTAAGELTTEHLDELKDEAFVRRPRTPDEIGRAQLVDDTLLARGLEQFGEHQASGGLFPSPTLVWITKPNSITDCIWFWNCRALRPLSFDRLPIHLLPHRGLEHWVGFGEQFQSTLSRAEDIEPDVVVCSLSVDDSELESIAHSLGLRPSAEKRRAARTFPSPPVRSAPFTYRLNFDARDFVLFNRQYGRTTDTVIQVGTPKTLLRAESPVRFSGGGHVFLRISSAAFDPLPKVPTTAELILKNADWAQGQLQVRSNADSRYHLELHVPELEEVVWAVLRSATADAELSDKGRLAHRVDTLASAPVMSEPKAFELVSELTTPRSKELRRELARLRRDGHDDAGLVELAAAWGGRTQRRHRSSGDLRGAIGEEAHAVAELLASEGWFERGLEIRCDQCTIRSFVPLSEVAAAPECPACSAAQAFERSPGLSIYYRLNGLIDRASDQGVVPHLIAQAALLQRDPRTRVLMGVDVRFADGAEAEVDLFGVHSGHVVAGEAKTSPGEFSIDQLRRDVELSRRLGASIHLLISSYALEEAVKDRALGLAQAAGMRLFAVEGQSVVELGELAGGSGAD